MREARHGSVRRRSFTRKAIPPPSPFPPESFPPPSTPSLVPPVQDSLIRDSPLLSFDNEASRGHSCTRRCGPHRRSTIGKPVSITVSKASCVAPAIRPGGLPPPRNSDRELQQEFKHPVILPTHLASSLYMTRAP